METAVGIMPICSCSRRDVGDHINMIPIDKLIVHMRDASIRAYSPGDVPDPS
uniref:Uncharacterized protein n=1 Tax=Arundo donax TaxID=35708 RepID=A0A0A9FBM1_ARUDO